MVEIVRIDLERSNEWGLTLPESYLFSVLATLPSWSKNILIEGEAYYPAPLESVRDCIPLVSDKVDTFYRIFKSLSEKNIIKIRRIKNIQFIQLTDKGSQWDASFGMIGGKWDFDLSLFLPKKEKEIKKKITPEKPDRNGYVYLMHDKSSGFHKIGFSSNPEVRERTIQAESPSSKIVLIFPGNFSEEKALHRKYSMYRVRGEWFNIPLAMMNELIDFFNSKQ